jgi:hypothetical protein
MFLQITCLESMIEIPIPDTVNGLSPLENRNPEKQDPEDPVKDALLPIKTLAGPSLIDYLFL